MAPNENLPSGHALTMLLGLHGQSTAQSDQGFCCPLTESLATIECINEEQRPGCDFVQVHDGLNPRTLKTLFLFIWPK